MKKLSILLTLMALAFFGFGCKSPEQIVAEKAIEQATGGKVQVNGTDFKVQTEQGTITGGQKLPAGFPSYIPIYKNSILVTGTTVNESAMYVSFESPDSVKTIYDWYRTAMKDWQLPNEANYGPTALLMFEKGTEKVNVSITGEEGTSVFDASGKKVTSGGKTTFIINWVK